MARKATVIAALIAKHEAAIAKLNVELSSAPSEYVPAVGEDVRYTFGRAETKAEYVGKVLAVVTKEDGSVECVVLTGEGADTQVRKVLSRYVKPVVEAVEEESPDA